METQKSEIDINYSVIKITQSRINKGLLAIPVSILDKFPKEKKQISVYFDDDEIPTLKHFTPYNSSSRECRIGGMAHWFAKNNFQDKDTVFIDFIDEKEGIFRLRREIDFVNEIKNIENSLTQTVESIDVPEIEIAKKIAILAKKKRKTEQEIWLNQYLKIQDLPITERQYKSSNIKQRKENVPLATRRILEGAYQGKCQISDFTFIQKNGKPYFEIHHIDENRGNDFKNLLVVSPNIHAQFTYGDYQNSFDNKGWLDSVVLCNQTFKVKQLLRDVEGVNFYRSIYE